MGLNEDPTIHNEDRTMKRALTTFTKVKEIIVELYSL
jgi:hypothetical protein